MGSYLKRVQKRRVLAAIISIAIFLSGINLTNIVFTEASVNYVTLYFVDNT